MSNQTPGRQSTPDLADGRAATDVQLGKHQEYQYQGDQTSLGDGRSQIWTGCFAIGSEGCGHSRETIADRQNRQFVCRFVAGRSGLTVRSDVVFGYSRTWYNPTDSSWSVPEGLPGHVVPWYAQATANR